MSYYKFRITQTTFTQRKVISLIGPLKYKQYDYFELYDQIGISETRDIDVQAFLGVTFFAECARLGISLPSAKKIAFEIIPEGMIFLASEPSNWHVQGDPDSAYRFVSRFNDVSDNDRRFLAQDLLNIRGSTKRFMAQISASDIHISNGVGDLFDNLAGGGASVVDVHGLAKRLCTFHNGPLFKAMV